MSHYKEKGRWLTLTIFQNLYLPPPLSSMFYKGPTKEINLHIHPNLYNLLPTTTKEPISSITSKSYALKIN